MRKHLLTLYELQQIDVGIRELENRRQELPGALEELAKRVVDLNREIEILIEQRDNFSRDIKGLEGTVKAEAHKVRKWEARLGDIRNQREYLALSREVESAKRANREMEDKILELMGQREQTDKRLDELQDQLAEHEVDLGGERDRVDGENAEVDRSLGAEKARREGLLPDLPKALLRKYEFIREKRAGIGIVAAVGGCCHGCNMRLPPQLFNILQRVDSLEQCPSCQRIVFWDGILPDPEATQPEASNP